MLTPTLRSPQTFPQIFARIQFNICLRKKLSQFNIRYCLLSQNEKYESLNIFICFPRQTLKIFFVCVTKYEYRRNFEKLFHISSEDIGPTKTRMDKYQNNFMN